jgi:methylmalonyl-CoA/ethylmalonyl-CoA epimerase
MKATEIDHICIAVKDLDQARKHYEEILGLEPHGEYEAPSESIRVVRYYLGSVALELMEPLSWRCDLARFLNKKGEGVFLISYRVDDVAVGLSELKKKGVPTIDREPRRLMGNSYAFIAPPNILGGVLTEILDGEFDDSYENPSQG